MKSSRVISLWNMFIFVCLCFVSEIIRLLTLCLLKSSFVIFFYLCDIVREFLKKIVSRVVGIVINTMGWILGES